MEKRDAVGKMSDKVTMIIADEDTLAREGLKNMLQARCFAIVAEAHEQQALIVSVRKHRPNIVILESSLFLKLGEDIVGKIKAVSPATKVVLIGTSATPETIIRGLQAGAAGYIPKSSPVQAFQEACLQVAWGKEPVLPDVASDLLLYVLQRYTEHGAGDDERGLTPRQLEVLQLMVKGLSNKEIAEQLHLSETTVKSHVTAVLRKLGATDRTQAVVKALNEGIVEGQAL